MPFAHNPAVVLVGDDSDPQFRTIASAVGASYQRFARLGDLDTERMASGATPEVVILHRVQPDPAELRLVSLWRRGPAKHTRILLCTSPIARFRQLEPWYGACDAVLSEATAPFTLSRYLGPPLVRDPSDRSVSRRRVAVISCHFELRVMLCDLCHRAGFRARPARDWSDARGGSLALWDIPVLEPSWAETLRVESRRRRIIGLAGFCDRELVASVTGSGGAACLDLPFQADDLAWVLQRVAQLNFSSVHAHAPHEGKGQPHLGAREPARATSLGRAGASLLE